MKDHKHSLLGVLLLAAIGAAAALPARAALFERGLWEFDFGLGSAIPMGTSDLQYRKATFFKASALRKFEEWLSAGIETTYSAGYKMKGSLEGRDFDTPGDGVNDTLGFDSDAKRYIFSISPMVRTARWYEFEGTVLRPYAILGLGLYYSWTRPSMASLIGPTSQGVHLGNNAFAIDSKDRINIGINLGAGLDQKLTDRFSVGLDLRYHRVFSSYDENQDGRDNAPFEIFTPTLKLTYYF